MAKTKAKTKPKAKPKAKAKPAATKAAKPAKAKNPLMSKSLDELRSVPMYTADGKPDRNAARALFEAAMSRMAQTSGRRRFEDGDQFFEIEMVGTSLAMEKLLQDHVDRGFEEV